MQHTEQWIWLSKEDYPNNQETICSGFGDHSKGNYTVCEFSRNYQFSQKVVSAHLRFSGDTLFQLYCNGKVIATGPASVGGDYTDNDSPREHFFACELDVQPHSSTLDFFARVQMMPFQLCDYSKGHGGFMLSGILTFEDGTKDSIATDESWLVRKNGAYCSPHCYDGRIQPDHFVPAHITENIWHTQIAPIPVRTEQELFPAGSTFHLQPGEEREAEMELDKIYAGFLHVQAETQGLLELDIFCRETCELPPAHQLIFTADGEFRGFPLLSTGNILARIRNRSNSPAKVTVSYITTCYPVADTAETVTDDIELNQVLSVCRHTLQYCRQTHHLDSPKHCEPLACTGDYYIESLMTMFSFGDMGLAEFDLLRTAQTLIRNNGRMFHTTYGLIWVKMLYDVYMAAGNKVLLLQCLDGLGLLLKRFENYIGNNGLIETPPDYMFVDWIYIDRHSMHHPPKALGQTCLNMFYFGALDAAEKIYQQIDMQDAAADCIRKKEALRDAVNTLLFDQEKGIYFEGLNTPTPSHLIGQWMPENTPKRYYLKHSNILAAYFGICDDQLARQLIEKVVTNEIGGNCQPYFAHYLLEAIYRCGLRERFTCSVLDSWKAPVQACPKGLVEGFFPPEPAYSFDHSHAWGGTPLYSLPKALLGLEIIEPGMRKIKLTPSLLGMKHAKTELMTPYGKVICEMHKGQAPRITHPEEVAVIICGDA